MERCCGWSELSTLTAKWIICSLCPILLRVSQCARTTWTYSVFTLGNLKLHLEDQSHFHPSRNLYFQLTIWAMLKQNKLKTIKMNHNCLLTNRLLNTSPACLITIKVKAITENHFAENYCHLSSSIGMIKRIQESTLKSKYKTLRNRNPSKQFKISKNIPINKSFKPISTRKIDKI